MTDPVAGSGEQESLRHILVTGSAGFIGYHLCDRLLHEGHRVTGIDNLNAYYDTALKQSRLDMLTPHRGYTHAGLDLADRQGVAQLFKDARFDAVVNLAAQAGVRYSLKNPFAYVDTNLSGFVNILEGCRHSGVRHLVFASSSSVYGANTAMPFSVHHNVDHPVSLYAATKKANELMAHAYSSLYGLPVTGLRFFTVYGPWGRPDMSYFLFTRAILENRPIDVFNNGDMRRDFTYIDDIIEGVYQVLLQIPAASPDWSGDSPDPASSYCPYRLYNIGNNNSVSLMRFIEVLEGCLGRKAEKHFLPMQKGDVQATWADVDDLGAAVGFRPSTSIEEGLAKFVEWFREYYQV